MKNISEIRWFPLVVVIVFLISGCSSLDKARSLYQEGQDEAALDMAEELLEEDEPDVRVGAVKLIGEIGGDRAGQILMPLLKDKMFEVKLVAIKNLGKMKYEKAAATMIDMGLASSGDEHEALAGAVRDIGEPAIDLLVKRYNRTEEGALQEKYRVFMMTVGPAVASGITKTLAGKSFFENRKNFELLVAFKSPEVAGWMLKEIENEEVADMVVEGLVKLGPQAFNPVMQKLNSFAGQTGDVLVKERLITVLGNLKNRKAVSLLVELTRDDNERVRDAADLALKKVRGF